MTDTTTRPATTVALDIGGMTCASCAARITKRLNKLDGVDASVNYATEQATVTLPDGLTVDDVVAQVEAIGYTATIPTAAQPDTADDDERP
jgi:Cu+-exporting ATPase